MAETSNRAKTAPQQARSGRSTAAPQLSVRYWKRMRPNKVYPVFVTCSGGGDGVGVVTLRMVAAGAQVVPAEQEFDPSNAREKVTFYVTPIAYNGLRGERLEVLRDGHKIQEIRLPSKVCTQSSSWVWLFLAFFLPWLILHYLVYSPIGYEPGLEMDGTHKYVPKPSDDYAKDKPLVQAIEEKKEAKDDKNEAKDEKKEEKKDEKKVEEPRAKRITDFVKNNTPDLKPALGDSQDLKNTFDDVQSFPERIYVKMVRGYRDMDQKLAFYLFLLFLFIALVSCIFRREARKTVRGRPLPAMSE